MPARTVGSGPIVAAVGSAAFSRFPSSKVTRTEGMVTVASVPDIPATPAVGSQSATIIPIAPAFWTFLALMTNAHVPRSTRAILPARAGPFVIALQPSVVSGPAPSAASVAITTGPETETTAGEGPKSAVPTAYVPAEPAGAVTTRLALRPMFAFAYVVAFVPFQTSLPVFVPEVTRSASVAIWSHVLPAAVS